MEGLSLAYLLARLEQRLERIEAGQEQQRQEAETGNQAIRDELAWLKRMAWIVLLWVPGTAMNVEPDKAAGVIVELLGAARKLLR